MKRFIHIIVLLVIASVSAIAQNSYNSSQIRFRNDVTQFLKEEGYSPTINNSTGDINFKMEGTSYVIGLNTAFSSPYLVTLSASFSFESMSSSERQKLYEVENTINSKFNCIKASYAELDGSRILVFSVESFCHNSDDFKYALVKYLSFIKEAIEDFRKLYSGEGSSSTSSYYIDSPSYTTTSGNKTCKITGVEVGETETKIYFEYTNRYSSGGWCSIAPFTYIKTPSGTKYYLSKADGIPQSPKEYSFDYNGQKLTFTLIFPALPSGTSSFDLIESSDSEWKFYNIKIK